MNQSSKSLSRQQVWGAFVQETIHQIANSSKISLELEDELPLNDVTKYAFDMLGENGIIRSTENYFCSECTH